MFKNEIITIQITHALTRPKRTYVNGREHLLNSNSNRISMSAQFDGATSNTVNEKKNTFD